MKTRHEVLFKQLNTYRKEIIDAVENISEEQADIIPKGFRNNIRWNLGHVYLDQYLWMEAITKEKQPIQKEFSSWFGFGTTPANFDETTPSLLDLKILLLEQPSQIRALYGNRLEEEFPPSEMGMQTIEQVLIRTIFHEGMHLQAINDLKKLL
ncbi:DinB family protein [Oceanobacillus piezotolerans]|uniref:DinB family protein n=1 Tax=Oceanobacillus piezotolerans TaxID=2448030 RepID=A0A498D5A0_9BACI|nr:DinB family protein [Oceanobacillus piezotolerans]RLL44898.1 DinB family protein [Oceanobacillus piezotolerans]